LAIKDYILCDIRRVMSRTGTAVHRDLDGRPPRRVRSRHGRTVTVGGGHGEKNKPVHHSIGTARVLV
jgi:hypothetical protein